MRFALRAIPIGVLGCAAALLVACGDRSGLLSSNAADGLQQALASVDSACANGDAKRAASAAQRFRDQIAQLSSGSVDTRLIANLEQGSSALDTLVVRTCTGSQSTTTTTPTTPTETTTAPTTSTTPTETTTTPTQTATTPTTSTTPTTPTTGGETTPNGGGTPGNGNGNGPPGGVPPGQANGGAGGGQ